MHCGDTVLIPLGDAGQDPRVFSKPQAFQPDRPHLGRQLTFGAGEHKCPGAHFARSMAASLSYAVITRAMHISLKSDEDGNECIVFGA